MAIAQRRLASGEEIPPTNYSEIPWVAWCRNSANSICENCQRCVTGECSWHSGKFIPVDGWIAKESDLESRYLGDVTTYKIYFCPNFILDSETEPLGMAAQYNVICELIEYLISGIGKVNTKLNHAYNVNCDLKIKIKELEGSLKEHGIDV